MEVAGNVESEVAGHGEFDLGPTGVTWDSNTHFVGATNEPSDLVDCRVVPMRGRMGMAPHGDVLGAAQIDTRDSMPGLMRPLGTVSGLRSIGDFRVEGQRVNAAGRC